MNERGEGERADAGTGPRLSMIDSRRISAVLPGYNAEATLSRTGAELDREVIGTPAVRPLEPHAETPEATDADLG
jgi:hypothetical protein